MCPKDMDVPAWKTYTQIANAVSNADGDGLTDRSNTVCPFHHYLNGGGIKNATNEATEALTKNNCNRETVFVGSVGKRVGGVGVGVVGV